MKPSSALRFILSAALIALTAILLQIRGRTEVIPKHVPLSSFPAATGNLGQHHDRVGSEDSWKYWAPATSCNASIKTPAGKQPDVDLFIAYFPSQRTGDTIHSPQTLPPRRGMESRGERPRYALHAGSRPFPRQPLCHLQSRGRASWCCIGFGPMIAASPVNTGPSFIWSRTRFA